MIQAFIPIMMKALAGAAASAAVSQAVPKYGMTTPEGAPEMTSMDIDSLLEKPKQAQNGLDEQKLRLVLNSLR